VKFIKQFRGGAQAIEAWEPLGYCIKRSFQAVVEKMGGASSIYRTLDELLDC
jgi:hypothetical protein